MKIRNILLVFFISFLIANVLAYLDYETVSLIEIYRDSKSVIDIIFLTFFLFIPLFLLYYIIYKIMKRIANGRSK